MRDDLNFSLKEARQAGPSPARFPRILKLIIFIGFIWVLFKVIDHNRETPQQIAVSNPTETRLNFLPDGWDWGQVTAENLPLFDHMGPGDKLLGYIPRGTVIFFSRYRRTDNCLRKVISVDGSWKGYACIFPTEPYKPVPIRPGWESALREMSSSW
jgi:hypothetical protein